MPITSHRALACALAALGIAAFEIAGRAPAASPQDGRLPGPILEKLHGVTPDPANGAFLLGLPAESRPEVLTWERIYKLALIKARSGPKPLAPAFDPKAIDAEAGRLGFGDFARFGRDFLAGAADGGFRDPSGDFYDVLRRQEQSVSARRKLASLERLREVLKELINGESSGLTQLELDEVGDAVHQARSDFLDRSTRFRDRLDAFKVGLGLSPAAPIALDGGLGAFPDVFRETSAWSIRPNRELSELDGLVQQVPPLGDLTIDGRAVSDFDDFDVERIEGLTTAGGRAAAKPRGDAGEVEVEVRREIRRLCELRADYRIAMRRYVLTLRRRDLAFEQLIAPPQQSRRLPDMTDVVGLVSGLGESQDRLVAIWTEHQALRLALARDLGTVPAADWTAFLGALPAHRGQPEPPAEVIIPLPAPRVPPGVPAPPPAPGPRPGA